LRFGREGSGANAQFNQPRNIVIDAIGNLYVADETIIELEDNQLE
jgi:hypothetical protein